jgi:hypothetical protein
MDREKRILETEKDGEIWFCVKENHCRVDKPQMMMIYVIYLTRDVGITTVDSLAGTESLQ